MTDKRKTAPESGAKERRPPAKSGKLGSMPGRNAHLAEQTRKQLGKHYANRYRTKRG